MHPFNNRIEILLARLNRGMQELGELARREEAQRPPHAVASAMVKAAVRLIPRPLVSAVDRLRAAQRRMIRRSFRQFGYEHADIRYHNGLRLATVVRYIGGRQDPYMVRTTAIASRWVDVNHHRLHRPDAERDPHDHPWVIAVSVILSGWYAEELYDEQGKLIDTRVLRAGDVNVITHRTLHRIAEVAPGGATTSLFLGFGRVRKWGFVDRDTGDWTEFSRYLSQAQQTKVAAPENFQEAHKTAQPVTGDRVTTENGQEAVIVDTRAHGSLWQVELLYADGRREKRVWRPSWKTQAKHTRKPAVESRQPVEVDWCLTAQGTVTYVSECPCPRCLAHSKELSPSPTFARPVEPQPVTQAEHAAKQPTVEQPVREKRAAVCVFIQDDQERYLMMRRHDTAKRQGGKWMVPGGIINAGETAEQAARRECMEEIGCKIQQFQSLVVLTDESPEFVLVLAKARLVSGQIPRAMEPEKHQEPKWLTQEQIERLVRDQCMPESQMFWFSDLGPHPLQSKFNKEAP